jgi:chromosome segregation ATPase
LIPRVAQLLDSHGSSLKLALASARSAAASAQPSPSKRELKQHLQNKENQIVGLERTALNDELERSAEQTEDAVRKQLYVDTIASQDKQHERRIVDLKRALDRTKQRDETLRVKIRNAKELAAVDLEEELTQLARDLEIAIAGTVAAEARIMQSPLFMFHLVHHVCGCYRGEYIRRRTPFVHRRCHPPSVPWTERDSRAPRC